MVNKNTKLVRKWLDDGDKVKRLLKQVGSGSVKSACKTMSLRELGRRTELSPSYLSLVANRKTVISPAAFLKVCGEIE